MDTASNSTKTVIAIIALVIGLVAGYFYGSTTGYKKGDVDGYKRAEADVKKLQDAAAKKATDEAVKAANPFQATNNPLKGVESNPFEKAKKVLNPF